MGKLYVIGIGPGGLEHMTLRAKEAIEESNIVVGYNKYIDMIKPLVENKELFSTGMRGEEARCRKALELSKEDNTVALISTGDSGIYGMAGLILQLSCIRGAPTTDPAALEAVTPVMISTFSSFCIWRISPAIP